MDTETFLLRRREAVQRMIVLRAEPLESPMEEDGLPMTGSVLPWVGLLVGRKLGIVPRKLFWSYSAGTLFKLAIPIARKFGLENIVSPRLLRKLIS